MTTTRKDVQIAFTQLVRTWQSMGIAQYLAPGVNTTFVDAENLTLHTGNKSAGIPWRLTYSDEFGRPEHIQGLANGGFLGYTAAEAEDRLEAIRDGLLIVNRHHIEANLYGSIPSR
jgi:hypothetical protein